MYDTSFSKAAQNIGAIPVCIIGWGCGGGQKEAQLAARMKEQGAAVHFVAVDVSPALVLTAHRRVGAIIGSRQCNGLVCDLATTADLPQTLAAISPGNVQRLVTFFGLIPNFEPEEILPKLAASLLPNDVLLFSANLAPGEDYRTGVEQIFPLYDNEPTREWLMTFLWDLGVEKDDGTCEFSIEQRGALYRVQVNFRFSRPRQLRLDDERFGFYAGETIQLFFSYRHTTGTIRKLLSSHGLDVIEQWLTPSAEEGVFLCRKLP